MFLMNLSFMDFLFYVPFFCTAAAAVTEFSFRQNIIKGICSGKGSSNFQVNP
jgi:hypothetical protein